MKQLLILLASIGLAHAAIAAVEEPVDSRFKPASPDPARGDWQGTPGYVAQVIPVAGGKYQANVFTKFDEPDAKPLAVLKGELAGLVGDGWSGAIAGGHFTATRGADKFDLQHITRTPPTLGAKPPAGAIVLFDGKDLNAWAKKAGKDWLKEDGPAPWKLVDGVAEVVPATDGGILTHRKFGDYHLHAEFRTLGAPSNSGIYLETRYEANINETYGALTGTPNGGFDNCTPKTAAPKIRASRPPLEWQTFDIDFRAPRFDAAGQKIANPRATVLLNGVKLYDEQELNQPTGAAGRLGEAPTGPILLQEHGMPVQFRNIWLVEKSQ
jgi:3-keto-disaccharide hydrolase